jgi:hypothetical protein
VYKSRKRVVVTLSEGEIEAREVLKHCGSKGCVVAGSTALSKLVAPRQRYGWDLIVHVGLARYLMGMQRDEIRTELRGRYGIELSQGTVSNLCDRFLIAFEALHTHRAPAFRAAMGNGYWLHLDATGDRGKGGLFVCLDGWRGWVLLAARIPSENGEVLRPLVDKTVSLFGDPIATVRDLGDAIGRAVEPLRERGVIDLLCHFHFLAAVGKKLFDKPHSRLQARFRALKINADLRDVLSELRRYRRMDEPNGRFGPGEVRNELLALVLWVLEGDGTKPPTYPFSLPQLDLARRCWTAVDQAEHWVTRPRSKPELAVINLLDRLASKTKRDPHITSAVLQLEQAWIPFTELRDLLRLSNSDLCLHQDSYVKQVELPDLALFRSRQIEAALANHSIDLRAEVATVGKKDSRFCPQGTIVDYLERYGSKLVGHPAIRDSSGKVLAVVDRTNNPAERLFSVTKQRLRRRIGRAMLGRDLDLQPAQAVLVTNLLYPDYVRVLCGSLDNLPAALAQLHLQGPSQTTTLRDSRNADIYTCLRSLLQLKNDLSTTTTSPTPIRPSEPVAATVS